MPKQIEQQVIDAILADLEAGKILHWAAMNNFLDHWVMLARRTQRPSTPMLPPTTADAPTAPPPSSIPSLTPPSDKGEALRHVLEIMQEKGFIHTRELTRELNQRYHSDFSPEVLELMGAIDAKLYPRDLLTLMGPSTSGPMLSAQGHVAAKALGKDVVIIMSDFGNFGGTNNFFEHLIETSGLDIETLKTLVFDEKERKYLGEHINTIETPRDMAHALTDMAARLISAVTHTHFNAGTEAELGESSSQVTKNRWRSGGDEASAIRTGITKEQADKIEDSAVQPAQHVFIASAGLMYFDNPKKPGDKIRSGTSQARASASLNSLDDPQNLTPELDHTIKTIKKLNGSIRQGHFSDEDLQQLHDGIKAYAMNEQGIGNAEAEAKAKEIVELIQLYAQETRKDLYECQLAKLTTFIEEHQSISRENAYQKAQGIINKQMNLETFTQEEAELILCNAIDMFNKAKSLYITREFDTIAKLPFADIEVERELFEPLAATRLKQFNHYTKEQGVETTHAEYEALKFAVTGHAAIDPVTGLEMPRYLPQSAAIYAEDAERYAEEHGDEHKSHAVMFVGVNTAGLNEISFAHGNIVLEHIGAIIREEMERNNMMVYDKNNEMYQNNLFHLQGGDFIMLVPPVATDSFDYEIVMGTEKIDHITAAIAARIDMEINHATVVNYYKARGMEIKEKNGHFVVKGDGDEDKEVMIGGNPLIADTCFTEIVSPTHPNWKGIQVISHHRELSTRKSDGTTMSGGHNIELLKRETEQKLAEARESRIPPPASWHEQPLEVTPALAKRIIDSYDKTPRGEIDAALTRMHGEPDGQRDLPL